MILIIDDDIAVRTSLALLLKKAGYATTFATSREEVIRVLGQETIELVILDMNLSKETDGAEGLVLLNMLSKEIPHAPVILITGWATIDLAVKGMKAGAFDFIKKPWDNQFLLDAVKTALNLNRSSSHTPEEHFDFDRIIGADPQILAILETVKRISATDASVLIVGESGTGKELIAEAIHQNSHRRKAAFVKVNLGGISTTLFDSEMFGHVKGAFTDAKSNRVGRFELANNGTIFLDEIGDLDPGSQVKLLRVLQDRTYEVLGSSKTQTVNTRVVCATNRDLEEMLESNRFREDLFYRINLITIRLPPLRERSGDIPMLANFYVNNLKALYGRKNLVIDKTALQWLSRQPFPGNIRQLKNLVERTVLVSAHDTLSISDFAMQIAPETKKNNEKLLPAVGSIALEELEMMMIQKAMGFYEKNISKVAKSLGLSRGALYRRLEKYSIPYEDTD
jgi:two-component system, NtrC family, response regulator